MVILDTNVVSELMRPMPAEAVRDWLQRHAGETVATTVVSVAEITFGLARLPAGARRDALNRRFFDLTNDGPGLRPVPLNRAAAEIAGVFRAIRQSRGRPASFPDMLIAGIVALHGFRLVTRDVDGFAGLPIEVLNPWE